MSELLTLRGVVLSRYKTIGDFAEAIKWKRNKASRVLNGVQQPDAEDIQQMAKCLEINSADAFMQIFFRSLSTLWTNAS